MKSTPIPVRLRAALYVRVSTRDKGQTVENQLPVLRAFAAEHGWDIVLEFSDHDHGDKPSREGFNAMMKAAKARAFDVLVFWSLDRFTREGSYPTLDYLKTLDSWGVRFRSYTEQYLDTCGIFRDAIIALLAALANQEQIRLRERVRAGIARAKLQGKRIGRAPIDISLDRFQRMDAVYSVPELMQHLQIGRSTVYDLRNRVKLASTSTGSATDTPTSTPNPTTQGHV
jgi:DNA invertase Pin-like site-specific DNA recombinase